MNKKILLSLYFALLHATTSPVSDAERSLKRASAQAQLNVRLQGHQRLNAGLDYPVFAQPPADDVPVTKSMSTPRKRGKSKHRRSHSKERKQKHEEVEVVEVKQRRPVRSLSRSNSVPFNAKRHQIVSATPAPARPAQDSPAPARPAQGSPVPGTKRKVKEPRQRPQSVTSAPADDSRTSFETEEVRYFGDAKDNSPGMPRDEEKKRSPEHRRSRSKERKGKKEVNSNKPVRPRSSSVPNSGKRQQIVRANVTKKENVAPKAIVPNDESWTSYEPEAVYYFGGATDRFSMSEFGDEKGNAALASSRSTWGDSVATKGYAQTAPRMSSKLAGKQDVQLADSWSDLGTHEVINFAAGSRSKTLSTKDSWSDAGTVVFIPEQESSDKESRSDAGTVVIVSRQGSTDGRPRAQSAPKPAQRITQEEAEELKRKARAQLDIFHVEPTEKSVWEAHEKLEELRGILLKADLSLQDLDRKKVWLRYRYLTRAMDEYGEMPGSEVCLKHYSTLARLHAKLALGRFSAPELTAAILARAMHYADDHIGWSTEIALSALTSHHNKIMERIIRAEVLVLGFEDRLAEAGKIERVTGLLEAIKAKLQAIHVDAAGSMIAMAALASKPTSWAKLDKTIRRLIKEIR